MRFLPVVMAAAAAALATFRLHSLVNAHRRLLFAVLAQDFKSHVSAETYVILGNDVVLRCDIPSFVVDMVTVVSWHDNEGNAFASNADAHIGKRGWLCACAEVLLSFTTAIV